MTCPMCQRRGQTWNGEPPRCAFPKGDFVTDNYACATMLALRGLPNINHIWNEDQYACLIPFDCGRFIVLGWYKHRGNTEIAGLIDERDGKPLSLFDAESALREHGFDVRGPMALEKQP